MVKGIEERELQTVYHTWMAARQTTNCRVEIVSLYSGVCAAALLRFACHPCVRGMKLVMRQQRGENGGHCPYIDINALFHAVCSVRYWSNNFEEMDRCLPLVKRY